jgi:hypothetical protein
MKKIVLMVMATVGLLLSSCSGSDYVNVIPEGSIALISFDVSNMNVETGKTKQANLLMSLLQADDPSKCGIDLSAKMYLFEAEDGNLGIAAKIGKKDELEHRLESLSEINEAQPIVKKNGNSFTVLRSNWLVGYSDEAVLVMGPVIGDAQSRLMQQMGRYLKQTEEDGIKNSPLFARLDSIDSPMCMVAQARALPEKFVSLFTLGAPKDADASQVVIAAEMKINEGSLYITGETFSFNQRINQAIKESSKVFRPITSTYTKSMSRDAAMGLFLNVNGAEFLKLMQQDKGLVSLLAGINSAIDMDNIIRSVDGDMAIIMPSYGDNFDLNMSAKLESAEFLKDVDYWKQSCPEGGRIIDKGGQSWSYSDGKSEFFFAVTPDNRQFLLGSNEDNARKMTDPSATPIDKNIIQSITGQKMATVINIGNTDNEVAQMLKMFLEPLFGDLRSLVYIKK